jgi:hypothetical protein
VLPIFTIGGATPAVYCRRTTRNSFKLRWTLKAPAGLSYCRLPLSAL